MSVVARFGSEALKKSPPCSLVWLRSCVYLPVSRLFELKLWSIRRTSWRVFCRSGALNEKRFGARPAVVEAFNGRVRPFERIRRVHRLDAIPRTALGKVRKEELRRAVARAMKSAE